MRARNLPSLDQFPTETDGKLTICSLFSARTVLLRVEGHVAQAGCGGLGLFHLQIRSVAVPDGHRTGTGTGQDRNRTLWWVWLLPWCKHPDVAPTSIVVFTQSSSMWSVSNS